MPCVLEAPPTPSRASAESLGRGAGRLVPGPVGFRPAHAQARVQPPAEAPPASPEPPGPPLRPFPLSAAACFVWVLPLHCPSYSAGKHIRQ